MFFQKPEQQEEKNQGEEREQQSAKQKLLVVGRTGAVLDKIGEGLVNARLGWVG